MPETEATPLDRLSQVVQAAAIWLNQNLPLPDPEPQRFVKVYPRALVRLNREQGGLEVMLLKHEPHDECCRYQVLATDDGWWAYQFAGQLVQECREMAAEDPTWAESGRG